MWRSANANDNPHVCASHNSYRYFSISRQIGRRPFFFFVRPFTIIEICQFFLYILGERLVCRVTASPLLWATQMLELPKSKFYFPGSYYVERQDHISSDSSEIRPTANLELEIHEIHVLPVDETDNESECGNEGEICLIKKDSSHSS